MDGMGTEITPHLQHMTFVMFADDWHSAFLLPSVQWSKHNCYGVRAIPSFTLTGK